MLKIFLYFLPVIFPLPLCVCIHVLMRDEKEERKKQARSTCTVFIQLRLAWNREQDATYRVFTITTNVHVAL